MTSHPPAQCCAVGVKHEGQSTGEMKRIGDTETYFAYPKDNSTDNAILLFSDVMGNGSINSQLVADQLAANGYLVVMPDLYHGDPVPLENRPEGFDIMVWLKGHQPDRVEPVVDAVIKEMRGKMGVKRLGAVGYCFGAKYVVRNLKEGRLDVGFVAHPSFVEADELKAIKSPLSIAAAETDQVFPAAKRHESEEILAKIGVPYQINLFSGVEHGFAVRIPDLGVKEKRFAKEQAFLQAVHWFDNYLKQ